MTASVRTLIVDDEPVARDALRALLAGAGWQGDVREACDGLEALEAFRSYRPQLVFLDVELPGMSGIEALERSDLSAAVVFTTAHDDAAITAFELGAIDYLRKPFGGERFALALERAQAQLAALDTPTEQGVGVPLAERLRVGADRRPLARLFVRDRRRVVAIATSEIIRCQADDDYVKIHDTGGAVHQVYINLRDLLGALDPARFLRIHRSHVVNLEHVAGIAHHDPNRVEVRLKDGTRLVASRSGTQLIKARLGGERRGQKE
jgi:two-component system LytT family response regulator